MLGRKARLHRIIDFSYVRGSNHLAHYGQPEAFVTDSGSVFLVTGRVLLAYHEEPPVLLCEGVALQVFSPRAHDRLVGDPTP
jgi:hypothetical protein